MKERSTRLGTEEIKKLLISLSLPATIGMIVNALYNIIDTIFVGRGVGTLAIGALTIAFPIQMLIMAFALAIGVGAAAAVSINLGKGDTERADKVAGNSFLSAIVVGAMISILGLIFISPILTFFGATPEILPYAKDYISVIFIGTMFYAFSVSSNNLIRAEGNAKVAMLSMVIGTGLNIPLDYIFIFIFNMGIKGAAIATIISQFSSFIFVMTYLYSGKSLLKIKLHHLKPDISILKEIFAVGSAAFARQIAGSIVAIILNKSLSIYGTNLDIAILGTVNKITMFLYMPLFGVVQGMQPIVGFNYGAKKMDRVKETVKLSLMATTVIAIGGFLFSQIFSTPIMSAFSKEPEFIQNGADILRVVVLMVPVIGIQVVGSTLFQSIGKAMPSLILSLLRQVIFFIPLVIILPKYIGISGIWKSFPVADFGATVITAILMINEMKKLTMEQEKYAVE
ncbi:MATE family efflux transporter [Clostridium ganghwense]|uniref:Multidrug export protein MepA n=1 Tax=Clostridium ganghwense TaxID=312089 RepID=A0ABT4CPR9_9CLOT|nr:MATE family efflux transporter [Clostridium ganghwense]